MQSKHIWAQTLAQLSNTPSHCRQNGNRWTLMIYSRGKRMGPKHERLLNSILCSHSNTLALVLVLVLIQTLNSQLATLCYRVSHLIYYVSRIRLQLDKYIQRGMLRRREWAGWEAGWLGGWVAGGFGKAVRKNLEKNHTTFTQELTR